jgi:hypothetical protein
MLFYDAETQTIVGPAGSLPVLGDDEIAQKLLMLMEGQCSLLGPQQAAEKFGFTKQRYYRAKEKDIIPQEAYRDHH